MMAKRAREIVDYAGEIEVLYQGQRVWIEQIDGDSARVRLLDRNQSLNVPVNMLAETGVRS